MELFFIIIAIIYWSVKCSKSEKEKHMDEVREAQTRLRDDMTKNLSAPKSLQDEIRDRVRDPKNFDKICEELKIELSSVYGDDYRSKLEILPTLNHAISYMDDGYWIEQILLAKRGKVDCCAVLLGYALGSPEYAATSLKYCQQIERALIKAKVWGNAYVKMFLSPSKISAYDKEYNYAIGFGRVDFWFNLLHYDYDKVLKRGSVDTLINTIDKV